MDKAHAKRIQDELKRAGAGAIGRRVPESHELVKLIHAKEHIGGVVYGVYPGGLGWLVATNQRVIFLDRKPLFATHDDLTYDIVVGTTTLWAGLFVSVILHTRIHDYVLRFVNPKSARIFTDYVESRRLSGGTYDFGTQRYYPNLQQHPKPPEPPKPAEPPKAPEPPQMPSFTALSSKGVQFLQAHNLGVLSTVDRTGNVYGAVVYYHLDERNFIYVLTKTDTAKGRNVYAHNQVAFTVYDSETRQTLQLQGLAEVETDQQTKDVIHAQMTNPHLYENKIELPPVTKLHEGAFMIIRVRPTVATLHNYAEPEV